LARATDVVHAQAAVADAAAAGNAAVELGMGMGVHCAEPAE